MPHDPKDDGSLGLYSGRFKLIHYRLAWGRMCAIDDSRPNSGLQQRQPSQEPRQSRNRSRRTSIGSGSLPSPQCSEPQRAPASRR